jgi:hypothetical protein
MKTIVFLLLAIGCYLLIGCTSKIEVPEGSVGLVSKDGYTVEDYILAEGTHELNSRSVVVIYRLASEEIDFDFEFQYNDAVLKKMNFSLAFSPIKDKLPEFWRKYNVREIKPAVEVEIRSMIRRLTEQYKSTELAPRKLEGEVLRALAGSDDILGFIDILRVGPIVIAPS